MDRSQHIFISWQASVPGYPPPPPHTPKLHTPEVLTQARPPVATKAGTRQEC